MRVATESVPDSRLRGPDPTLLRMEFARSQPDLDRRSASIGTRPSSLVARRTCASLPNIDRILYPDGCVASSFSGAPPRAANNASRSRHGLPSAARIALPPRVFELPCRQSLCSQKARSLWYNERALGSGAQTCRPGEAGPVSFFRSRWAHRPRCWFSSQFSDSSSVRSPRSSRSRYAAKLAV
jgi:hypothetical protein